jgi:uncharacterized RDD family membrane protein YckC
VICPACGEAVSQARERCPACGALLAPPAEGSLAPLPSAVTPPARGGPARELAGMKKRERTWQDEVKDRVRSRRQTRSGAAELPLFTQEPAPSGAASEPVPEEIPAPEPEPNETDAPPAPPRGRDFEREDRREGDERQPRVWEAPLFSPAEGDLEDLPLRPPERAETEEARQPVAERPAFPPPAARPSLDELPVEEESPRGEDDWDLPSTPKEPRPVERPALPQERLQAAAVDLALLAAVWTVVVYFASRAAHVSLGALRPSWPWMLGYLAFLGLVYASYFTGTTGQTLGKMVTGLRVLQASSRPPGYMRSFLRAGVGALGILAVGLGQLPMLFDPARRGLHDRLFGTRVVKH